MKNAVNPHQKSEVIYGVVVTGSLMERNRLKQCLMSICLNSIKKGGG